MSQNKYLLKWENGTTKHSFGPQSKLPLRLHDRNTLAESMTFQQIIDTGEFVQDDDIRRKYKWKAIRNFYTVTQQEKYKHGRIEKALWTHAGSIVTSHHFVSAIIAEFNFDNSMYYDRQLRNMYFSFEGGKHDKADWRDILATFKVMVSFRFVKENPLELIMSIFDIYTTGDNQGKSIKKEYYVLQNASEYVRRIMLIPCITTAEVGAMDSQLVDLFHILKAEKQTITHLSLKRLLESPEHNHLVKTWAKFAWERLPTDLRLIAYDEAQMRHRDNAEALLMRHKLAQAILMYNKSILRLVYREWKLEMLREAGVRNFINRILYRKRHRFFKFWDRLTGRNRINRRRRYLAEVMGNYSLKARSFARIKLFNYNAERVHRMVGNFDRKGRQQKLGGFHLREYSRKSRLRKYYHRWWNKCVDMINHELVVRHDLHRILRSCMLPWHRYAHEKELAKRNEEICRENKLKFDRSMEEAEEAAQALMKLERERAERERLRLEEERRLEREQRLKEAQDRLARQKEEERKLVLSVQKEERQRRVDKVMKQMKVNFKAVWEEKTEVMLHKAKSRITAYIENKDNTLAIDMKFEQLKREFFQPPTPENTQREAVLSSLKNIVFLYLQAKLRADLINLSDLVRKFDKGGKGFLTYSEFKEMILSIGADISPAKISAVIRGVDVDGDKCIDIHELEASMKETDQMGTVGSAWRWYIDPAENVMTYHNFVTGERIFDYQMRDKKLREICIENMYGEADHQAVLEVQATKTAEWEDIIRNYMASRLQYMFRRRKGNKWRQKSMFKLMNAIMKAKTDQQRYCVRFMERTFAAYKVRLIFRRQLRYAFEKIYDVDSGKLFWYNCSTGEASWDRPYILGRYEDVTSPPQWISTPVVATEADYIAGRRIYHGDILATTAYDGVKFDASTQYVIHYWHVVARKSIPRKPDGLPLCCHCERNIAAHFCESCQLDYCLACHRGTHGNPFGFHQHAKATKEQYSDPGFLQQLKFHSHPFKLSKAKRCQLCRSTKICAGLHCDTCELDLCRACSRRIHEHSTKQTHIYYSV